MAINSRQKGKRNERALANKLQEYGYDAHRGQQTVGAAKGGKIGQADVIGLPGIHIECKAVERLDMIKAMEQSRADAKAADDGMPMVFWKKNRTCWMVNMDLADFMELYSAWSDKIANGDVR